MRFPLIALAPVLLSGLAASQTPLTTVRYATGVNNPIAIDAPRGDSRVFIADRPGRIYVATHDFATSGEQPVLPTPFLNISSLVNTFFEGGLLGIAFDPDYANNGHFYVSYTNTSSNSVLRRYTASPPSSNTADPNSGLTILTQNQPQGNHNGGCIRFGPDGYLYMGFGDGGGAGDSACNAQNLNNLLGAMIRIDVSNASPGTPYTVPADNPFVGVAGLDEIFHYGLRNPWRFSFDRLTGDLYIGDVGQNGREEISYDRYDPVNGFTPRNFGWKIMEGTNCYGTSGCSAGIPTCNSPALTLPIRQENYGTFTSITGGYVYGGCAIPDLRGTYFYCDYSTDIIRSFRYDNGTLSNLTTRTTELAPAAGQGFLRNIASWGEDGFGELYLANLSGNVFKLVPAAVPAGLIDCDGNGLDDPCEIEMFPSKDLDFDGTLDACQLLSADVAGISASAQGRQNLSLHAGPAEGNRLYVLAGSVTGTSPGFPLHGLTVPLNIDVYFNSTLAQPNLPPLVNSIGFLDANGDASAAFDLANVPLPPFMIGLSADHAFATVQFGTAQVVSNPVRVNFLP
ncbi:MAG: PQQ-dependent sugar dehydrogenase [Planctomycetota bacterium]